MWCAHAPRAVNLQVPAEVEYKGWNMARSFHAEIKHFVDAIEGGYEPLASLRESTETLRVILAGYRSAAEGIAVMP